MSIHKLKGLFNTRQVWLDGIELDPKKSQAISNHSPDGFSWGYGGSGPAQLAMSIMIELNGSHGFYNDLKWDLVAKLPVGNDFEVEFTWGHSVNRAVLLGVH